THVLPNAGFSRPMMSTVLPHTLTGTWSATWSTLPDSTPGEWAAAACAPLSAAAIPAVPATAAAATEVRARPYAIRDMERCSLGVDPNIRADTRRCVNAWRPPGLCRQRSDLPASGARHTRAPPWGALRRSSPRCAPGAAPDARTMTSYGPVRRPRPCPRTVHPSTRPPVHPPALTSDFRHTCPLSGGLVRIGARVAALPTPCRRGRTALMTAP